MNTVEASLFADERLSPMEYGIMRACSASRTELGLYNHKRIEGGPRIVLALTYGR